ncbi:MAG: VWA domain-containing protein [Deltaproteobacteria bacterium]|nr:VWA domain-containing protein [Deltaproteobacteria bacterium]
MRPTRTAASLLLVLAALTGRTAAASPPLVRCGVALDREVLYAGPSQRVVIKVSLDAPPAPRAGERPPINLAVVLDRSGSMAGDKIEKAREAAIEALRRLGPRDLFSLVAYDHEVDTVVPAQSAGRTEWIEGQIRSVGSRGNTALFGGVSQGAAEVRKNAHRPYVNRVILLSDGLANVGPSSPSDLGRLGAALRKEGISVSTVGVGTDFNEDLMTRLAEKSDGYHYFVESSRDLPRIFAQELGDLLSVVARGVVVEIECARGVRPVRIIGREGRISGDRVEVHLNQLYGGQGKYVLVEVEVPAGRPDAALDLAVARCSYENALSQRAETSSASARARFSTRAEDVRRSANRTVQQSVVDNEMAGARDQALDLYNAGKSREAAQELRRASEALQEKNAELGFQDLSGQAAELDKDAGAFESQQVDNLRKKEIRSDSYKVRSQRR